MKDKIKIHSLEFVRKIQTKHSSQDIYKVFFIIEQYLIGGKNKKYVENLVKRRLVSFLKYQLPSPYRPRGVISSVDEWIKNDNIPPEMEGSWIKEIFPPRIEILKTQPITCHATVHSSFIKHGYSNTFPSTFLCFMRNARIVNENGVIISFDDRVYSDLTFDFGVQIDDNSVFRSYIHRPSIEKRPVATLCSTASANYFHWMFDCLPRLFLLEGYMNNIKLFIVPFDLQKFHIETLNLFNISEDKLIKIKDGDHYICERLYVPSFVGTSGEMPEWACKFLRSKFLRPDNAIIPSRFIYISRKDAPYRKVLNEDEVEHYLKNIGFEIMLMSTYSFEEQVRICSEAKVVVASHGAGLSNTVFCNNAKIVEILYPSYTNVCYWNLSNKVGNDYYYIMGENVNTSAPPDLRDIRIDICKLKYTLENIVEIDKLNP